VDDRGKNLVLPEAPPGDEEPGFASKLFLAPPSMGATKIALVRGFTPIVLAKSRATASFPAPKEDQTATAGDFQFRIVGLDPDQHALRLKVSSKKLSPEALSRMDFVSHVTLKDWESTASSVEKVSWDAESLDLGISYTPMRHKDGLARPGDGAPQPPLVSVEVSAVTAVHEKRIPFEFRDLKLK